MRATYKPYSSPSLTQPKASLTSSTVPAWVSEVGLEWLYELISNLEIRWSSKGLY